jgi:hypothetical protein
MVSPSVQRLIAAGASPQRARSISKPKVQPMSMPEVATPEVRGLGMPEVQGLGMPKIAGTQPKSSLKPMGPNEWYNDDYVAASQSWLSGKGMPGYQVPEFGTPEIKDYFEYTKGPGAYQKIEEKAYVTYAPQFSSALKAGGYERYLANLVKGGMSLPQIYTQIQTDFANKNPGLTAFPKGSDYDVVKSASGFAKDLYNEYGTVKSKFNEFTTKVDPNYRYALPDPKFKYGATTNFKAGTIDVLNNYWAFTKYKAFEQQLKATGKYTPAQITKALTNAKTQLATAVTKSGQTPFNDEKARRDALKKSK